jgi:acyl-CoA dehydrogenase
MGSYRAPLRDLRFVLEELADLEGIGRLPGCAEATPELVRAVLEEAARFAEGVLAPLNGPGDREGCGLADGRVRTPAGWDAAYRQFREAGWVGLGLPTEVGGQGLPKLVATAVWELWFASNLAFALLPQLNTGQTAALLLAASDELKQRYLHRIVSGEWAATMNLTEPQAGSDLAATRTRAEPQADGSFRLFGQKIFISYGEHELTPNIVHLVLARLPDAPPGVKGISLFLVPKFLPDAQGRPGTRNDLRCIALEHKLGIHGSPTCAMSYGDAGGAVGWLVGERNRGLETMFIMMNEARFGVGVQGYAVGEAAYQRALAYARERRQGRDAVSGRPSVPIIEHPDVKRMLLGMRARIMAARTLACCAAGWFDRMHHDPDGARAARCRRFIDLLMPVVKGWGTELGNEVTDLAIQVHGGMGYVEETGVAQLRRDARIITIYEGTTGIQANDLVGRKILREDGATLRELIAEIRAEAGTWTGDAALQPLAAALAADLDELAATLDWMRARGSTNLGEVLAGAVPFLHQLGTVCGSWQMGRAACAARGHAAADADPYYQGIVELAQFWFAHHAPQAAALARVVRGGGASVQDSSAAAFGPA